MCNIDPVCASRRTEKPIVVGYEEGAIVVEASVVPELGSEVVPTTTTGDVATCCPAEAEPDKANVPSSVCMTDTVPAADATMDDAEATASGARLGKRRRKADSMRQLKELQVAVQARASEAPIAEDGAASVPVV